MIVGSAATDADAWTSSWVQFSEVELIVDTVEVDESTMRNPIVSAYPVLGGWVVETSSCDTAASTWSEVMKLTSVAASSNFTRPYIPQTFRCSSSATSQAYASVITVREAFGALTTSTVSTGRIAIEDETRKAAEARATHLLTSHLTPPQRESFLAHGWFEVRSRSGNRYRIHRGTTHNVRLLDAQDREVASYCAHPTMKVPVGDVMLSQKLLLEFAEDRFLGTANVRQLMGSFT